MSSSNDYNWNADAALQAIIDERGQTKVVFMNGLWTPLGSTQNEGFQKQWRAVEQTFGLVNFSGENQTSITIPGYKSSFQFEPIYNPSKGNDKDEKPKWFFNFATTLAEQLFKPAIQEYERLGLDTNDGTYKRVKELANDPFHWLTNIPKVFTQGSDVRDKIGLFLQQYGNLADLEKNISGSAPKYDPNSDLIEAFAQFFTDTPALVSKKINEEPLEYGDWKQEAWLPKAVNWLKENPNNSLIVVGHSQGNFFLEDGLMNSNFKSVNTSQIRVIALGSPTDYSSLKKTSSLSDEVVANFKNPGDAITDLQFPAGTDDNEKISKALEALNWKNLKGLLFDSKHDLEGSKYAYLNQSKVKDKFKEFAYNLNSKGYYFPDQPKSTEGTVDGDYLVGSDDEDDTIRGYGQNDVLRGNKGNDILIGDDGWDFLDGGDGTDTADYLQNPGRIVVHHDKLAGSDVYTVQDGYGQEDILVNVEKIFGSNNTNFVRLVQYYDHMYGGEGNDYFYGLGGKDKLIGNGGNDYLNGGNGNDLIKGGRGQDRIRGGQGQDTVYGKKGNDHIHGGDGDDILRGGMGNDILKGDDGNDTLEGGLGNDTLNGGAGNNYINAGTGDNIIYGGSGTDLFVLNAGIGADTIINFDMGKDSLGLTNGLTFDQLSITQGTNGNEFFTQIGITSSGDLLATLDWVQASNITSSSFTIL